MKYSEINKRYTEKVTEYMNKGYTINTSTMSGNQGEIAHIDLTNGIEIIRIVIDYFSEWDELGIEGLEILVGRATDNVKPNDGNRCNTTIWNNRLEIIHRERFYEIGKHTNYYGSKEEAEEAARIRYERWELNSEHRRSKSKYIELKDEKAIEIAKKIIHTKLGYNRINTSAIKLTKHITDSKITYTVSYNTKAYHLK